jgi:hypothetical protein
MNNPSTFSVNAAADLLERDRRTIRRALAMVPPDGGPSWMLSMPTSGGLGTNGQGRATAIATQFLTRSSGSAPSSTQVSVKWPASPTWHVVAKWPLRSGR